MPPKSSRAQKNGRNASAKKKKTQPKDMSAVSDQTTQQVGTSAPASKPRPPEILEIVTDDILEKLGFEKLDSEKKQQALKHMNQFKNYSIEHFIDYYIKQSGDTKEQFFKKHGDDNIKSVREVDKLKKIIELKYGIYIPNLTLNTDSQDIVN